MIVEPYTTPPRPPLVAVLADDGLAHGETGSFDPAEPDRGVRMFAAWETVRRLLQTGMGEALCWNNQEIKWRVAQGGSWAAPSRLDVAVLRLPVDEQPGHTRLLNGIIMWRDWLASCGAAPATTGGAAWSLLRASLDSRLVTGAGDHPPIRAVRGGRQQLGVHGPGSYRQATNLDLPSAYARVLGQLAYGRLWQRLERPSLELLEREQQAGRCVFAHATVQIPDGIMFGPLPRTIVQRREFAQARAEDLSGWTYPTQGRLQGCWTLEELQAAEAWGTRIVSLDTAWVMTTSRRPFALWWERIQQGRSLGGLAGLLAKMTGNALWGRFALSQDGARTTLRYRGGRPLQTLLEQRGGGWPARELAETVTGRVRAQLYAAMMQAGERMLTAHTDGIWVETPPPTLAGWRVKQQASRLDLLGPQALRYRTHGVERVVLSGTVFSEAAARFQQLWDGFTAPAGEALSATEGTRP